MPAALVVQAFGRLPLVQAAAVAAQVEAILRVLDLLVLGVQRVGQVPDVLVALTLVTFGQDPHRVVALVAVDVAGDRLPRHHPEVVLPAAAAQQQRQTQAVARLGAGPPSR